MSVRMYRLLIVASFMALGISILIEPAATRALPAELRIYLRETAEPLAGMGDVLKIVVAAAYLAVVISSAVGLYRLRSWARPLAVTITLLTFVLMPLLGPRVESGWTATLLEAEWLLWGMVLALSYWSPVAEHFVNPRGAGPAA